MSVIKFFLDPSQILLCLGTIIATIVATVYAYHEKRRRWMVLAVPLSGFLVYAGTIIASFQQAKDEAEIFRLTQENNYQQINLNDFMSGGKMMCLFYPILVTNNLYGLQLGVSGSCSPDMRPSIYDLKAFIGSIKPNPSAKKTPYRTIEWPLKGGVIMQELDIGTINTRDNIQNISYFIDLNGLSEQVILIRFFARNGSWVEIIQFELVDGGWVYALSQNPSLETKSFIEKHQSVPDNFPTNKLYKTDDIVFPF